MRADRDLPVRMATATFAIGKIEDYDEEKEFFDAYIESLEHWMSANAINAQIVAGDGAGAG